MPFSGITQTYAPDQGQKSLDLRQKIRHHLENEGVSGDGIRQLLANEPLASEADRQAIHGVIIRLLREHSVQSGR